MELDRSKGQWFVLHTLSGQENNVRRKIEELIRQADASLPVYEAFFPTEKVTEIKNGKRQTLNRKTNPGYVFVRVDLYKPAVCGESERERKLDEDVWHSINGVQGVISFLGGSHPSPLPSYEVENLLAQTEEATAKTPGVAKVPAWVAIGATVRIIDGVFQNFKGLVQEIDAERGKLKLMVTIFGRSTPVELEFWQVGQDEE